MTQCKPDLYTTLLMDHYKNPRHHGVLVYADFHVTHAQPSCGDSIEISGRIDNGRLVEIKQRGVGCMVSQATASILAEHVLNKEIAFIESLTADDVARLIGTTFGPQRMRCAMIALEALQEGLKKHA